jgi:uncharacterized protein YcaQ
MLTIDQNIARRFILGKQGLWPGRRWRGVRGIDKAIRAIEYLQLDPLQIVARAHDLILHSRVLEYKPGMWEKPTYQQRKFFDWGGWLAVRPMDELPYWRVVMRNERDIAPRIRQMGRQHAKAVEEMRAILRERGTVSNRDFDMSTRRRTLSYRGRKDSALALYYLWRIGEVMTHHREKFERVYSLAEAVAPAEMIRESSQAEVDEFLIKKEVNHYGLLKTKHIRDYWLRYASGRWKANSIKAGTAQRLSDALLSNGDLIEVKVEGWKEPYLALGSDMKLLRDLNAGRVPKSWTPLDGTTTDEVIFLSPLDQVSARGRAKVLFDFDYVWEVYKPLHLRKFGYYVMPILWGDHLVGRFDSKLDRTTNTFTILGFWLEDQRLGKNEDFAEALARGFARFVEFLSASKLNTKAIREPLLRKRVSKIKPSN